MPRITVERLDQTPVEEQEVEIVERKGKGHPDSMCDGIANAASLALCQAYVERFGRILHHNLDKMMLVAGRSSPRLGGGAIDAPMKFIFGDRAAAGLGGQELDLQSIVFPAAKDWFRENLRFVDPEKHVVFQNEIKPGSAQISSLFDRKRAAANDTSAATGFAPLTLTERTVPMVEQYMNSPQFKNLFPETGEDIKVMGVRYGRKLHLTVAVAFVDRFVPTQQFYFARKSELTESLLEYLAPVRAQLDELTINVNTLDDPQSQNGMYLTVLGTSAEGSDSGQVGRGNRVNGIIALNRPQGVEAHAGKNPVNHVGKIYSYFATHIARRLYANLPGAREVYVQLCSEIGRAIDDPLLSSLKIVLAKGASWDSLKEPAGDFLSSELAGLGAFTRALSTKEFYTRWDRQLLCEPK